MTDHNAGLILPADALTLPASPPGLVLPTKYNGATYDRDYGQQEQILLPFAARTTQTLGLFTLYGAQKGVFLMIDVTSNPGGARTLTPEIFAYTSDATQIVQVTTFGAQFSGITGVLGFMVYPGAVETFATTALMVQGIALPRKCLLSVNPSDAASWTYEVTLFSLP